MTAQADQLSATFAALADPTRRAILARLAKGQASVNELAAPFDMTLPAVSKHLKVLERAGLVTRSREAQYRPCSFNGRPLKDADEWIERYRRFWEQSLDRLDAYLKELQGGAERRKYEVQGGAERRKYEVQKGEKRHGRNR